MTLQGKLKHFYKLLYNSEEITIICSTLAIKASQNNHR